ncbi:MAG: ferritin family protein [Proteobacteria bacterium]|nr:ferritin family protein [Pseudomonadota bacterium]
MFHEFNAKEILEMAEIIEQNGYKFYRKAADAVEDPDIKSFLQELADMEVAHEKTFANLKTKLSGQEKADVVFDPYDETALYIQALADTRVFYEKEIDTSSAQEVLKAAITAEKDSIVFYLGMKDLVPEEYGKDKIDNIIKEEMKHIRIISNKLLSLGKK